MDVTVKISIAVIMSHSIAWSFPPMQWGKDKLGLLCDEPESLSWIKFKLNVFINCPGCLAFWIAMCLIPVAIPGDLLTLLITCLSPILSHTIATTIDRILNK